ncbi:MAG TPA: hypothetical protein VFA50_02315 [Stellaceae bacterium]|nr:hypothetical protein [Stellaceae bacterium]
MTRWSSLAELAAIAAASLVLLSPLAASAQGGDVFSVTTGEGAAAPVSEQELNRQRRIAAENERHDQALANIDNARDQAELTHQRRLKVIEKENLDEGGKAVERKAEERSHALALKRLEDSARLEDQYHANQLAEIDATAGQAPGGAARPPVLKPITTPPRLAPVPGQPLQGHATMTAPAAQAGRQGAQPGKPGPITGHVATVGPTPKPPQQEQPKTDTAPGGAAPGLSGTAAAQQPPALRVLGPHEDPNHPPPTEGCEPDSNVDLLIAGGVAALGRAAASACGAIAKGLLPQAGKEAAKDAAGQVAKQAATNAAEEQVEQEMVWVNKASGKYFRKGSRFYGKTANGEMMTEEQAIKAGFKADAQPGHLQ